MKATFALALLRRALRYVGKCTSSVAKTTALATCALLACVAQGGEVAVAVAGNFMTPMQKIAPAFEAATGHKAVIAYGTVGKFAAQIEAGAPFDVLVSADQATPERLERAGLAVPTSRYTYAIGRLVLWSARPGLVDERGQVLARSEFAHLAIASPKLAVYGAAAVEVMNRLGLTQALQPKLVVGDNITQTHQFVASGNAELGFVALSQIYEDGRYAPGSYWLVPASLYPPIRQDVVLLTRGRDNAAAQALLDYMKSEPARRVIRAHGYEF